MSFLIIDGNSILNRSFYGIRILTNTKGVPTNAVTGFMNTLLMLKKDITPQYIAVAFDLKAPTFRHNMYGGYKANRKGMPDELAEQLPYTKKIIRAMGIQIIEKEGYEADDIIGTISAHCAENGIKCTISTGDRDSFQLVNEYVTVRLARTKGDEYYTPNDIFCEYGVEPLQMIDVKALMGDSSDNIPGVAGVGEKTALSLIKEFKSIDGVYENIGSPSITAGLRKKLENGKESCYMSRRLAEICLTAPINLDLQSYIPAKRDEETLSQILSELEMYKLLQKLEIKPRPLIQQKKAADAEKIPLMEKAQIVFDDGGTVYAGDIGMPAPVEKDRLADFAKSEQLKHTFNLKETLSLTGLENISNTVFDTTLAAYLAEPDSADYSAEKLCVRYGTPLGTTPQEKSITIADLNQKLYAELYGQKAQELLTTVEIPLASVLCSMEREGIKLDTDGINAFGKRLDSEINEITSKIYEYAGEEFNIASPKQLGTVLFDKLALPFGKKTKTGYSTNAEVLEQLTDKHPIVPLIMEYRALTKLSGTYVTGLLKVVGEDGRIHSTFKQRIIHRLSFVCWRISQMTKL